MNILDTHIAVNNETIIQIANIAQNHFIKFIQNMNNISAIKSQVIFESQIADQELLNHISNESFILFHKASSAFILSKIRIFASIAIHIDSISHAIDAKVNTIPNIFTINKTNIA